MVPSTWSLRAIVSSRVDSILIKPISVLVWNRTSIFQIRKIAITASKENVFLMPENPKTGLVNRVKNATIDETSLKRKEHLDQKEMLLNVADVEACEEVAVEVVVDPVATEEDVVELVVESNVISTGSLAMIRRE